jgi:hypothetical protein
MLKVPDPCGMQGLQISGGNQPGQGTSFDEFSIQLVEPVF